MIDTKPWWKGYKYSHIKIPKALFKNPKYANISPLAKLLYGFLLDRTSLSYASGTQWQDDTGNFFVYFPLSEISERLSCGHDKATAILKELAESGLIRRTRQKPGSPYKITVLPFDSNPGKTDTSKRRNRKSEIGSHDFDLCGKPAENKTEENNPDMNNPGKQCLRIYKTILASNVFVPTNTKNHQRSISEADGFLLVGILPNPSGNTEIFCGYAIRRITF